jgi:hypothetical protein
VFAPLTLVGWRAGVDDYAGPFLFRRFNWLTTIRNAPAASIGSLNTRSTARPAIPAIRIAKCVARAKCVLASVLDSARRLDLVAIVAKPLPGVGVRVFQRMETLVTERDDKLVPVELEKLVYLARPADIPAAGASGSLARFHRR